MKLKVYLRVAHGSRGPKVVASTKPNYAPLVSSPGWRSENLPTAAFALELTIPEEAFKRAAQVLASIDVPDDQIDVAALVTSPTEDEGATPE